VSSKEKRRKENIIVLREQNKEEVRKKMELSSIIG
jgi:hypothetical protein